MSNLSDLSFYERLDFIRAEDVPCYLHELDYGHQTIGKKWYLECALCFDDFEDREEVHANEGFLLFSH